VSERPSTPAIFALTSLALLGFAANSLLCRLALGDGAIDPASFTTVRLVAGALALVLIVSLRGGDSSAGRGSWLSASMLFLYAAAFSFAYVSLSTGTGALILFGAVQVTMLVAALAAGERPRAVEWLGLAAALGGLVYLVSPGLAAPSPVGSALMAASGFAWGIYSLRGRGAGDAIRVTRDNFVRSVPMVLVVSAFALNQADLSPRGVLLAAISGALTSGAGYAIWYTALPWMTATRAATVQLSVPILAAVAGVIVLGESVSWRLAVSAVLILGGVGLSLSRK